jgi:hypothetical protein
MLQVKAGVATILMLAVSAHAGTIMESLNKDLAGNRAESTTTTYAQAGQMRVEPGTSDGFLIFKNDTLYSINNKDKSYIAMDRVTMKQMIDQISPMMQQMQEQLAKMPPEQRAQMERMMGKKIPGMGQASVQEVRKTTRTGKAGGYACNYVEVTADGVLENELCVVAPTALKGGDELMTAALTMSALVQDMLKGLDTPWLRQSIDRQVENYGKIGGVPVLSRYYADGKVANETTLKSIRSQALPAATFEVPAGYSRKELGAAK